MENNSTCYLCGREILNKEDHTDEHIPPKQFFPKELRQKHNLQLITLPAHLDCNKSYALDEEYFRISLGPLAKDTFSGSHLWKDIAARIKKEASRGLAIKVRDEFRDRTEGGIYYPPEKIVKKFDADRIFRVAWKIIRGLHFIHHNQFIPEATSCILWLYDSQRDQPESIQRLHNSVAQQTRRGKYPGIFAYKIQESDPPGMYAYGFLLWDKIIFLGMFHTPDCPCEDCCKKG